MSRCFTGLVCLLAAACSRAPAHDACAMPEDPIAAEVPTPVIPEPSQTCTWLATYDLTGSRFYIEAQVDFTITVQEPYGEDHNTGPGWLVLEYASGPDGLPADGPVALVDYELTWDFVTGMNGLATVHTAVHNEASTSPEGELVGTLAASTLSWADPALEVCQDGLISCSGMFCGMSGSPQSNSPATVATCEPWALNDFVVSPDRVNIDMAPAQVSADADSETSMGFHGTLVDIVQVCQ